MTVAFCISLVACLILLSSTFRKAESIRFLENDVASLENSLRIEKAEHEERRIKLIREMTKIEVFKRGIHDTMKAIEDARSDTD